MSLILPAGFLERVRSQLGAADLPDFLAALKSPEAGLRANTLKVSPAELSARLGLDRGAVPGVPEGFVAGEMVRWGAHPWHAAGLFYLQDPGAMAVGAVADPRPDEWVLDLSAAPGGKATHLAARMENRGVLVANDVVRSRARELVGNLERLGVTSALVTSSEPAALAARFGAVFDRVVVDAPCSGESMFHKSAAARTDWSEAAVQGCAVRQSSILEHAVALVRPGGLLAYSTCTFAPEENERVIQGVLEAGGWEVVPLDLPGGSDAGGVGTLLWPHRFPGAGHFVSLLRRTDEAGDDPRANRPAGHLPTPERGDLAVLEEFHDAVYGVPLAEPERVARFGDSLVWMPRAAEALGTGDLRSGLELGSLRKGRFEPAHALAMRAGGPAPVARVDLEMGDPRVEAWLAGEVLEAAGPAGWVVVQVDGFALGWGKRTGHRVKNHYPKGLRRRG